MILFIIYIYLIYLIQSVLGIFIIIAIAEFLWNFDYKLLKKNREIKYASHNTE